jgi:hypothetical protein
MWKSLPLDVPANGSTVWIRVKYYYGTPFLAVYTSATQEFNSVTNSITYPAWTVARWKAQ